MLNSVRNNFLVYLSQKLALQNCKYHLRALPIIISNDATTICHKLLIGNNTSISYIQISD